MNDYFNGKKLYGDDFTFDQIKRWYKEEEEAYSDLGSKNKKKYFYGYHALNVFHGYDKLKEISVFENVLGLGSAWGYEFLPIIQKIRNITIIEPSSNLINNKIGNLIPTYVKPNIDGRLSFDDNTFDLITCFGTLHHIPNVSFMLRELIRVLTPNGYLIIREPIRSMGDWRNVRKGLTKNERGIPVYIFNKELKKHSVKVISASYCLTATYIIQNIFGKFFKKPVYSYKFYVVFDKFLSTLLKNNVVYHPTKMINKIGPSSIFYVIKKNK